MNINVIVNLSKKSPEETATCNFVGNIFLGHKRMEAILSIKFKPFNTDYDLFFRYRFYFRLVFPKNIAIIQLYIIYNYYNTYLYFKYCCVYYISIMC